MAELIESMPSGTMFDDLKQKVPFFGWIRWFQALVDVLKRPITNRVTASTNATAVNCTGAILSTGIGTGQIQPSKYAEVWLNIRATFNLNAAGLGLLYVYRTLLAIPANGAAPNAGDVQVGGDAFGHADVANQNFPCAMSWIDTGLDSTKKYRYYFAVSGPNAAVANLVNNSQMQASEF